MRAPVLLITAALLCPHPLVAQQDVLLDVAGNAADHIVSWTSQAGFNYEVRMSTDLQNWTSTGIVEPGANAPLAFRFQQEAPWSPDLYYQLWASPGSAFLLLPSQGQEVALTDGVCFSLDLNIDSFDTELPERIRISTRLFGSQDPWELIGDLREIRERTFLDTFNVEQTVRFLSGSAVWIPEAEGEYEVWVEAVASDDTVMDEAIRRVGVGENESPTIEFVKGPPNLSTLSGQSVSSPVDAEFEMIVNDDTAVTRVEFFSNGVLIGIDLEPPFGDALADLAGTGLGAESLKLHHNSQSGVHTITAIAYDQDGTAGLTQSPWLVTVTGGNARPEIEVLSSPSLVEFEEPFDIEVAATDADGPSDLLRVVARELGVPSLLGIGFDLSAPFGPIEIEAEGTDGNDEWENWSPAFGSHILAIYARDQQGLESYPQYLRVYVREDTTPTTQTLAERLVANIVDPNSAIPSNELFLGFEVSSDEFTGGELSGLEIPTGILLTTGLFDTWKDGDLSEETSEPLFSPGDPELETRAFGDFTIDAAVLEFEVNCINSQLEIRIQFGSEEYIEYVGDQTAEGCKNDAILITVDEVPVSLVPACNAIIAVNNIHPYIFRWQNDLLCLEDDLLPDHEFLYQDDADIAVLLQAAMGDPANRVEYDGMTTALVLHALLEPGAHTVRIAIADVDDEVWDSGLFIQTGSVRTITPEP